MQKISYGVVVEWDPEEEVYVASIPALSVSTYGESRTDVLEKAKEAIEVTIDGLRAIGQPVPLGDEDKIESIEVPV